MTQQVVIFLIRRTLLTGLLVVAPLLAAGLVIGVAVAVFQAVTSIRDITLSMIPRILAVAMVLLWLLPWMLKVIYSYTTETLQWIRLAGV